MSKHDPLALWKRVAPVPTEAKKPIIGGNMKGKTDINPMWRLRTLTEAFGPCGVGWRYTIDRLWQEAVGDQIMCFAVVSICYREGDGWSEPIPGIGGNTLLKAGYPSDEGYKMAVTDAISVCCKALGIGSDVYWQGGESKYDLTPDMGEQPPAPHPVPGKRTVPTHRVGRMNDFMKRHDLSTAQFNNLRTELVMAGRVADGPSDRLTDPQFDALMAEAEKEMEARDGGLAGQGA